MVLLEKRPPWAYRSYNREPAAGLLCVPLIDKYKHVPATPTRTHFSFSVAHIHNEKYAHREGPACPQQMPVGLEP
jgi:hypothetical protein